MKRGLGGESGFSLIELLVVIGILGLVLTAVYSVYLSHMKRAFSQEEVIDVQQNLRFALDSISQDLTMAGILVPTGTNPVASQTGSPAFPNYSTSIRMTSASADGGFARVVNAAPAGEFIVDLDPPAKAGDPAPVDAFTSGDKVRIIGPLDGSSSSGSLVVQATNRTNNTLTFATALPADVAVGQMLARTADGSPLPHSVDYYLIDGGSAPVNGYTCPRNQKCLVRQVNGTGPAPVISREIIATALSSLRFSYLNDGYGEESAPSDPARIRAVRVTLEGATTKTVALSGAARNRSLMSVIKLRNRR